MDGVGCSEEKVGMGGMTMDWGEVGENELGWA